MTDKKVAKEIPIRDFVYLCVILSVVLVAVVSFFLGNSDKAGGMLSFAATAVSVVLAVIAIVMTITESSSQKQSILQLKEVTQDIEQQLIELKALNESSKQAFDELLEMKDTLQKQIESTNQATRDMISNLFATVESKPAEEQVSVEKVKEIIEKAIRKNDVLQHTRIGSGLNLDTSTQLKRESILGRAIKL